MDTTETKQPKFSLKLNLFDTIILLLALAVGGFLLWYYLGSEENRSKSTTHTIEYTILMNNMREGTGALVRPGSDLHDVVKKYHIGRVVSTEITQAQEQLLDHQDKIYRYAFMEGYEDVYVVVEATVADTGTEFLADGGYVIRVGQAVFLQGEGYMAAGNIVAINRDTLGGG